jgi:hypothetical protein
VPLTWHTVDSFLIEATFADFEKTSAREQRNQILEGLVLLTPGD